MPPLCHLLDAIVFFGNYLPQLVSPLEYSGGNRLPGLQPPQQEAKLQDLNYIYFFKKSTFYPFSKCKVMKAEVLFHSLQRRVPDSSAPSALQTDD